MKLVDAHNFIRYILQKERGGWVAPEEIDDVLDRGQWEYYNQSYAVYANDQKAKDNLSVFSTKLAFTTSTGLITLPTNPLVTPCYEHLLGLYVQYYDNIAAQTRYKAVKFFSENEIAERLDSQILRPTVADPVGEQLSPGIFQLYPVVNLVGYAQYLRHPVKPYFAYTLGGVDERTIIQNTGASIEMDWNESSMNKILNKAIQLAGVNLTDVQTVQYTESKNQQDI